MVFCVSVSISVRSFSLRFILFGRDGERDLCLSLYLMPRGRYETAEWDTSLESDTASHSSLLILSRSIEASFDYSKLIEEITL